MSKKIGSHGPQTNTFGLAAHRQLDKVELRHLGWLPARSKLPANARQTLPLLHLLDNAGDRLAERVSQHGATGLADGRQAYASPFLRMVVLQLTHQSAVRQKYERLTPGLRMRLMKNRWTVPSTLVLRRPSEPSYVFTQSIAFQ